MQRLQASTRIAWGQRLIWPRWLCALGLLLAGAAGGGAQPAISLDTAGGDAWTFAQLVEGRVAPGACAQVVVRSPAGAVPAWSDGERFQAEVPLQAGVNPVRAECWRDGGEVAASATQTWDVRLPDRPRAWIRLRVDDGRITLDGGGTTRAQGRPAPLLRYQWRARSGNPAPLLVADGRALSERPIDGEQLTLRAPAVDGEYYLTLRVVDAEGRVDESTGVFRVRDGRAEEVDLDTEHPAWVDRAVIYGVVPFFFGEDGYAAVRRRLNEIAALGATAIWLSPVNAAPDDDFGYAVTDHFRLRATFGSDAEFRRLVRAAHARGLKVIMDFVPNHFSDQHPYYRDADERGRASPYYDWFERDASGRLTQYFDWDNLKNLDYDNPEVRNYVIAAFAHWVREYGIDGFRVDAGWGVRQRAPEFWERWREELKRIDPDLFLLVEASARDAFYVANGFDAAYDWSRELGQWAWRDVFREDGSIDLRALRAAITDHGRGYPHDSLVFRFLNNNDTGERFITRHGPGLTRVAAALSFTLPGVPLIYTGDEIGAEFEPYDEGPPLRWHDRYGLVPHYAALARLRGELPALASCELRLLDNDRPGQVLSFLRPGRTPAEHVLVLLNFSDQPLETTLGPSPAVAAILDGQPRNLIDGGAVRSSGAARRVHLPAYATIVLRNGDATR